MNAVDTIYSAEELKGLSDKELYQRLRECWGIKGEKIEVWGELDVSETGNWAGIYDVRTLKENRVVSYPVESAKKLVSDGIFMVPSEARKLKGKNNKVWIKCELILSPALEREKQTNRFAVQVEMGTAQKLKQLPFVDPGELIEADNAAFISESVYDYHLNKLQEEFAKVKDKYAEQEQRVKKELDEQKSKLQQEADTFEKTKASNGTLTEDNRRLEENIQTKREALTQLIEENKKVEKEMAEKIEKLKLYIAEKASFLKDFEFIDEDYFEGVLLGNDSERDTADMLSFKQVLEGSYEQAVSYIQAHLKEQDTLYPRHIIENYLTLIRCNDLIILAGDSGSGKTKLVESFAEAVGGVSKIIPVKPNWTSSEDLLGYYNPLEKKYLATPFLEALIEAQHHADVPYFICLDEMNLARVEYYFADFLSKLEKRDQAPEIQLYSDDESAHVLSELRAVISIISGAKDKYAKDGVVDFVALMQDEKVNTEMKRAFGFSEKDSLIKYHGDIRRMLSGVLNTPSKISIPDNVRIVGTVNIDETTHYLSPKVLDRAHILKFKSPLLADWDEIFAEIESYELGDVSKPLHMEVAELGSRSVYPKFEREDSFCQLFSDLNKRFFDPLGVEFGMRTIRQGLYYLKLFAELNNDQSLAINNFIAHKVLPKFTFDGNKQIGNSSKLELIDKVLAHELEEVIAEHESIADEFSSVASLQAIVKNAKSNDGVVNYWA